MGKDWLKVDIPDNLRIRPKENWIDQAAIEPDPEQSHSTEEVIQELQDFIDKPEPKSPADLEQEPVHQQEHVQQNSENAEEPDAPLQGAEEKISEPKPLADLEQEPVHQQEHVQQNSENAEEPDAPLHGAEEKISEAAITVGDENENEETELELELRPDEQVEVNPES